MRAAAVLRWTARAWGIASTLLLLAFAFGGKESIRMSASEAVVFLCFPVGVVVGFLVAWRRELAGGLITVLSLALFYLVMLARDARHLPGPYFLLFAAPGFLHVAAALIAGRPRRGVGLDRPVEAPGRPGDRSA